MNVVLKNIVDFTYKPLLVKYLSKTREYRYKDIQLQIKPQVFHPGFFFSTQLLLSYINTLQLKDKNFLELGCGSGLIAIAAAKRGAMVTATDINPIAVESLKTNSAKNNVTLQVILSDLFLQLPQQRFDMIAINPPYYKKQPHTAADYAWYCGENGEYFSALFTGLSNYIHETTSVLMVLFEGCDLPMIKACAATHNFTMEIVHRKKNLLEEDFIYQIKKSL